MSKSVAKASVMLTADTGPFERGLRKAVSALGATRGAINGMASAAATATAGVGLLAAPIVAAGGAAIVTAARFETTAVALEVLTGSAAKAATLMEDLSAFAASTPFEFGDIANASRILLAFGSAAGTVTDELRMIGDLAAGIGQPLEELAQIYGKARVQGRLFGEDINQLQGRGIPVVEGLARRFAVTNEEVKKLVSSGQVGFVDLQAVLAELTAEGGRFGGMMERQSRTVAGLFSTMMDEGTLTAKAIGDALITNLAIRPMMDEAIERMGAVRAEVEALDTSTGKWLERLRVVGLVADGIAAPFQLFATGVAGILTGISAAGEGVLYVLDKLGEAVDWVSKLSISGLLTGKKAEGGAFFGAGLDDARTFMDQLTGELAGETSAIAGSIGGLSEATGEFIDDVAARAAAGGAAVETMADRVAAMQELLRPGSTGGPVGVVTAGGGGFDGAAGDGADLLTGPGQSDLEREARRVFEATRTDAEAAAMEVERLRKLFDAGLIDDDTFGRAIAQADRQAQELNRTLENTAARVIEATRTPDEVFAATIAELDTVMAAGLLDPETYRRAAEQARQALEDATAAGGPAVPEATVDTGRFRQVALGALALGNSITGGGRRQQDVGGPVLERIARGIDVLTARKNRAVLG